MELPKNTRKILTAEERACNFVMRERTRIFVALAENEPVLQLSKGYSRETDLTIRYQSRTAKIHLRERAEHPIPVAMSREHEAG
jgi:hypothetical protein